MSRVSESDIEHTVRIIERALKATTNPLERAADHDIALKVMQAARLKDSFRIPAEVRMVFLQILRAEQAMVDRWGEGVGMKNERPSAKPLAEGIRILEEK